MANISWNLYRFYGDEAELTKCYNTLNDLHDKVGDGSCVPLNAPEGGVAEWIAYITEPDEVDHFVDMVTEGKWFANPVYWRNWTNENFPKLKVAFMCTEPGMAVFNIIDPDGVIGDHVYVEGCGIPEELTAGLPDIMVESMDDWGDGYCLGREFLKSDLFTDDFKMTDMPDYINVSEYEHFSYEDFESQNNKVQVCE